MSEKPSSKSGKAKTIAVIGLVAVAFVFVYRWMTSKATTPLPMGSGKSNAGFDPLPNDIVSGGQVAQPSAQFGWVNANDRSGTQKLVAAVKWIKSLTEWLDVNQYAIPWRPNQDYEFTVTASLKDAAGNALAKWGVGMDIFDANFKSIAHKDLITNDLGVAQTKFNITPANAGIYRLRVAAGDAVDEQGIEFVMPSSLTMQQALGS